MQRQSFLKIAVVALLVLNAALLGWFVFLSLIHISEPTRPY